MKIRSTATLTPILIILLSILPNLAAAGTAFWTGKSEMVQTVTYRMAWRCEYNYNGKIFTELFESNCPSSVTIDTPSGYNTQGSSSGYSGYSGYSDKAHWSGESQMVQDANYQMVWRCIYLYNGQRIAKLFSSTCPSMIDVR